MRRGRFGTWAKWACTLAAVVAVGVAVASGVRSCGVHFGSMSGRWGCSVQAERGTLVLLIMGDQAPVGRQRRLYLDCETAKEWRWGTEEDMRFLGWVGGVWARHAESPPLSVWYLGTTVLYPVLLTTIPAAFLWYKDRPPRGPHACKGCGYDRRGIAAEGPCPECGSAPRAG
jgi:hypothetical protein